MSEENENEDHLLDSDVLFGEKKKKTRGGKTERDSKGDPEPPLLDRGKKKKARRGGGGGGAMKKKKSLETPRRSKVSQCTIPCSLIFYHIIK